MQQNNSFLLTISIPTYNRANYLDLCLGSIVNQIIKFSLEGSVEVIVSDNCSTDGTRNIVEKYQNQGVFLRYHKNDENIGIIKNFVQCIALSNGENCMIYGDDDLLVEGSLPLMIDSMRKNQEAKVYLFKCKEHFDQYVSFGEEKIITIKEFVEEYFYVTGNAGMFGLKTAGAKKIVVENYNRLITTCWPQTEVMVLSLVNSNYEKPALVSPVVSSSSPFHTENTYYNSWYLLETLFFSLVRVGMHIDEANKSKTILDYASKSIPGVRYFSSFKKDIFDYVTYLDFDYEVKESKKLMAKAFQQLSGKYSWMAFVLYLIVAIPRPIKKIIYPVFILIKSPIYGWSKIREHDARMKDSLQKKIEMYTKKGKKIELNSGFYI